jgi:hypothetical protein
MIFLFEGGDGLVVADGPVTRTPRLTPDAARPAAVLDCAARLLAADSPLPGHVLEGARRAAASSAARLLRELGSHPTPLVYIIGEPLGAIVVRGETVEVVAERDVPRLSRDTYAMRGYVERGIPITARPRYARIKLLESGATV